MNIDFSLDCLSLLALSLLKFYTLFFREKFLSAPTVFKQIRKVCSFFNYGSSYSIKPTYCRCEYYTVKEFPVD